MSTLSMILAVGAVFGSGPDNVSSQVEQALHFRIKDWEGAFDDPTGMSRNARLRIKDTVRSKSSVCFPASLWIKDRGYLQLAIKDEGRGRVRIAWEGRTTFGIYKQYNDQLVICYCQRGATRPLFFQVDENQHLLILYPIKHHK